MKNRKNKILTGLFLLLLSLAGYCWLMEEGLRHNRNFKPSFIQRGGINTDYLFLGPCETEFAINPDSLLPITGVSSYNLGFTHSDFAENYLNLYLFLKHNRAPKLLILYATPECFDSAVANTFNSYRFTINCRENHVKETIKEMDPGYGSWSWLPFMRYSYYNNFTLFKAIAGWGDKVSGKTAPKSSSGFDPPHPALYLNNKTINPLTPPNGYFTWYPSRERYFRKILKLAQDKHIPVLVYESHVWEPGAKLQKNRNDFLLKIDSICSEFNVPFKLFTEKEISGDDSSFYTVYNFTPKGIKAFNKILGEYLRDSIKQVIPGLQ